MDNNKLIEILERQNNLLAKIAESLAVIASASAPAAPNYTRTIGEYAKFDWASIGAVIVARDAHGVCSVEWGGYTWLRRAPSNKFGVAIWFSRADGKDADGNAKYVRLITFKAAAEAEPLPRKAVEQIK